jgi:hypothetical protein
MDSLQSPDHPEVVYIHGRSFCLPYFGQKVIPVANKLLDFLLYVLFFDA